MVEEFTLMKGKTAKQSFIHYFPVYGSISTGIIYVAIGTIAILSFLKLKDGGADESSLLAFLHQSFAGNMLLCVILLGTVCYVIWRVYETIQDPYGYGDEARGIAKRTGIAMSTVPDILICIAAVQVLVGAGNIQVNGQPVQERAFAASVLDMPWGNEAIMAAGVIMVLTALVQLWYGVTRGYKERLDIVRFSKKVRKTIHFLAWTGYFARSIIVGIIGYSFIKGAVEKSAHYIVNTDKAFDFIGDDVGHIFFILVAVGTIFYGLFMFALGITYDADKD